MNALESSGFDPTSGFRYLTLHPHGAAPTDAVVVYLHGIGERGDDLARARCKLRKRVFTCRQFKVPWTLGHAPTIL